MKLVSISRAVLCCVVVSLISHSSYSNTEPSTPSVTVQGIVFLDSNENGIREAHEPGLPNVQLSDGDQILLSDEQGRYTIHTTTEIPNTVFVITPNGYLPTSPFYHIIQDDSTSVDFALKHAPHTANAPFSFFHGADFQFDGPRNHAEQIHADLAAMEAWAAQHAVQFYTFIGDITTHGSVDDLAFFRESFDALDRPVHTLFGGHDGLIEMDQPRMGNFVNAFGPYAYAWNYGGVHFIALVSEGYLSALEQERQLRWWWRDMEMLAPGTPIILLAHTPDPLSEELARAAERFNIIAYLFGHWHTHHGYEVDGISLFTSSPLRPLDWGAFTKRSRVFHYDHGSLTSYSRVLEQEKRLVLIHPDAIAAPGPLALRACVYDTAHVPDTVEATVRTADGSKTWTQALAPLDEWTWGGRIEENLAPGDYTVRIQADSDPDWCSENQVTLSPTNHAPLRLKWITSLGSSQAHRSSPIILDGHIYQGVSDGQAGFNNAGVVCFDAEDGRILWKTPLPRDINATVCSDGTLVFAVDCQGGVYGLDRMDGALCWQGDVYDGTDFHTNRRYYWRTFLAPVSVHQGTVYIAGSHVLAAFSANDGKKRWCNYTDLNQVPYPVSGLAPLGDRVYFEDEHKVVALDPQTGAILWNRALKEFSGNTARERGAATPLATGDAIYFHHRNHLRKVHPATGDEIWTARAPGGFNYVGTPVYGQDKVLVSAGNAIAAYNATSGEEVWRYTTRSGVDAGLGTHQAMLNGSTPIIVGDYVIAGSDDGYLYMLRIEDGTRVWEYNTGSPIKASPALADNLLVVSNFAGSVMGYVVE